MNITLLFGYRKRLGGLWTGGLVHHAREASLANIYHSWKFYRAVGETSVSRNTFLAPSVDHNELPGGHLCGQPSQLPGGEPRSRINSSVLFVVFCPWIILKCGAELPNLCQMQYTRQHLFTTYKTAMHRRSYDLKKWGTVRDQLNSQFHGHDIFREIGLLLRKMPSRVLLFLSVVL